MADKIKVLIVDDNEDTRMGTQRLLEVEDNIQIVGIASNGLEGIAQIKALNPDVVLMDINMPVMDGLTATARIAAEMPRVQVIIVSVQDDPNYLREAIRAGAVDFVAKPVSSDELAAAIERAYSKIPADVPQQTMPQPGMGGPGFEAGFHSAQGHVIGVLGPKGGVGKTTLAVNLAIGIARETNDRILLIDGNIFFGDVGVFINARAQYNVLDLAIMAEDPEGIDPAVLEGALVSHESGIRLLLSPANPGEVSGYTASQIMAMLDTLKQQFDYIIIDTSTVIDDMMAGVIQVADRLILTATPTMPALKNTRILFSELSGLEYPPENIMLVLNRVSKTGRITSEQISSFLKHEVLIEIPEDGAADEAVNRGVPLITLDPRKVISVKPLNDLVQLIVESYKEIEEIPGEQSRGGFGLFRR